MISTILALLVLTDLRQSFIQPGVLAMGGWDTRALTDGVRASARRAKPRGHGMGSEAGGTCRSDQTGSGVAWLVDFLEGGDESAEVVGTIPPASHHTTDYFSQSPKEIPTVCTQRIHMSTIRVTDEVKERLRDLKRDDESFNDLLDRLSRSEKDVEEMAGFLSEFDDGSLADDMRETHEELNESLDRRSDE